MFHGHSCRKRSDKSPLDLTQLIFEKWVPPKAAINFSTFQLKKKKKAKNSLLKPASFRHESKSSSSRLENNDVWVLLGPSCGPAKQLGLEVIKLYSLFKSSKMVHLVPELDSEAERLSGSFQLGRFRDWETERKWERDRGSLSRLSSSPPEPPSSSISLRSSQLQEGGVSQL